MIRSWFLFLLDELHLHNNKLAMTGFLDNDLKFIGVRHSNMAFLSIIECYSLVII